ncbi:hypothetical protein J6590_068517 [Homalodisca vitripennis]|nr:hypothetical protein J6590_068517 [Homalodisca vitripennis]
MFMEKHSNMGLLYGSSPLYPKVYSSKDNLYFPKYLAVRCKISNPKAYLILGKSLGQARTQTGISRNGSQGVRAAPLHQVYGVTGARWRFMTGHRRISFLVLVAR